MPPLLKLADQFEQASRTYASSNDIERDEDWFVLKLQEELGELTQVWMKLTARGRRRGLDDTALREELANETADLLGHVLLFANRHDIDLPGAIRRKWRFDPETD